MRNKEYWGQNIFVVVDEKFFRASWKLRHQALSSNTKKSYCKSKDLIIFTAFTPKFYLSSYTLGLNEGKVVPPKLQDYTDSACMTWLNDESGIRWPEFLLRIR